MKSILLVLCIAALSVATHAQSDYSSSIYEYQKNYKKDLYEVIQKDTAFVQFFPVNESYRIKASVKMLQGQPIFKMATSSGITKEAQKIAQVDFLVDGKPYTLYAYQLQMLKSNEKYKDEFFIPFFDATNGDESYGGGRYLDFNLPDIVNNELVVDFNKAYNPYCAFRTGYNCPIPPRENGLKVSIRAGEKNFGKSNH